MKRNKDRMVRILLTFVIPFGLSCSSPNGPGNTDRIDLNLAWALPHANGELDIFDIVPPVLNKEKVFYFANGFIICRDMISGHIL